MNSRQAWRWHALLPAVLFALGYALMVRSGFDYGVVDRWFDPGSGVFPARHALWAGALHAAGRWLAVAVGVLALAVWAAGFKWPRWRGLRRGAGYVFLCFALGPGLVALGKRYSNVDCPWDLTRYGGDRPAVGLFEDRPDELPAGHCFPAGHSSGAFAFFSFYFVLRRSRPRAAVAALAGAAALGLLYAGTQWARGAHFPTHDLWTAWICWNACLALAPVLRERPAVRAAAGAGRAVRWPGLGERPDTAL